MLIVFAPYLTRTLLTACSPATSPVDHVLYVYLLCSLWRTIAGKVC